MTHAEFENLTGKKIDADIYRDMGYYLADQAEKWSATDLRDKAIEILGEKEYIAYKLASGHNLWAADRDLILTIIR